MKTYQMKLSEKSFNKIKNRQKNIEIRLFDSKRRTIKPKDRLIFRNLSNLEESILVEIVGLSIFSSFMELFSYFPSEMFGHNDLTIDERISSIRKIYDEKDERTYGVVGIHIRLVK